MAKDDIDKNQVLFLGLIQSLAASTWAQLGKTPNPLTGKIERNLKEASFSIDLLVMLQEKTRDNLNSDESKILENTIADLKINFVDEKLKVDKEEKEKQEKKEESKEPKKEEKISEKEREKTSEKKSKK
jgi:hypothetical protein